MWRCRRATRGPPPCHKVPLDMRLRWFMCCLMAVGGCDRSDTASLDSSATTETSRTVDATAGDLRESSDQTGSVGTSLDGGDGALTPETTGPDGTAELGFSTHVCTNSQPLTCPANDCHETAAGPNNDSAGRATPLGTDAAVEAILCAGGGSTEYDNYGVVATPGCAMSVLATFTFGDESPAGDLSMYLERAGSSVIQDTNSDLDGSVHIDVVSRSSEPYNVYLINSASTDAVYALSHDVDCAPLSCPENDRNEPNDTIITSSGGKAPLTQIGDVFGAIACAGESDWYFHPASNAGTACKPKAILRFNPELGAPLSVDMRISDATDLDESVDASTPGVVVVTASSNVPGTARVEVQPTGIEEPVYTIELLCD